MTVVVSDTSVIIDLERGELLDTVLILGLILPFQICCSIENWLDPLVID